MSEAKAIREPTLEPNLDVLRAFAVLAVYVGHLLQTLHVGGDWIHDLAQTGVIIFFVHTSLVLLMSLERTRQPRARLLVHFYVRRVFRIYPLSIVTVVGMLLLSAPAFPNQQFTPLTQLELSANLGLFQNLVGARSYPDPLWSLPFEVQMYGVLPALFWFAQHRGEKAVWLLLTISCAAVLLAKAAGLVLLGQLLVYVPCFLAGVLSFVRRSHHPRLAWWLWPPWLVALVGLKAIVQHSGIPAAALWSPWVTAVALGWSMNAFSSCPHNWLASLGALVSKYSYGLYLLQIVALWCAFDATSGPFAVQFFVCIAMSVALPVLAFHAVEKPMMDLGRRVASALSRPG